MQSNKKPMLVVALAVAVIALVGAGYAATNYTATTTNTNNDLSSTFITVNQGGAAAYGTADADSWLTGVYFDTVNTADGTNTYALVKEWTLSDGNLTKVAKDSGTMALACKDLSIEVVGTNSKDTNLTIEVEPTTTIDPIEGLGYKLALATGVNVVEGAIQSATGVMSPVGLTDGKWTFTTTVTANTLNSTGYEYFVLLLIDGTPTEAPTGNYAGFENCTFTFKVTADDA